ncbi:MAG: endolytic transglycosylase MltG [Spirochaetales bacterium]
MKLWLRLVLGGAMIALLSMGIGLGWLWNENKPSPDRGTVQVTIPSGEALAITAGRLQDLRIIRSAVLFKLVVQLSGGSKAFPLGTFAVPSGMSALGLAQWFRTSTPIQVRVTIPEGWTATKIARLLEEKQVVGSAQFLDKVRADSLEGTLFPDTYLFPLGASAEEVVRVLVRNFAEKTSPLTGGLDPQSLHNGIVMASIIEREYRVTDEAPLIGSVFWNRLQRGIPLASCATIEYILTEIQGRPHPKRIFFVYTQIESAFNTYLHKGLPPQPICNPGLTALKAAFQPAKSEYLYFVVADPGKGSHRFSSSYADHERAREQYLNTYISKS